MWINKAEYEVEKLKYKQRIEYLENLLCPCESHDYIEIKTEILPDDCLYSHRTLHVLKCKRCGKLSRYED